MGRKSNRHVMLNLNGVCVVWGRALRLKIKNGVEKGEGNSNFQRMEFEIQIRERAKIGKMCIGSMEVPAKNKIYVVSRQK